MSLIDQDLFDQFSQRGNTRPVKIKCQEDYDNADGFNGVIQDFDHGKNDEFEFDEYQSSEMTPLVPKK